MLDYGFWYDLATYGNTAWKGKFTPKEVATYAHEYCIEWEESVEKQETTHTIFELIERLWEDDNEKADEFFDVIAKEINTWR